MSETFVHQDSVTITSLQTSKRLQRNQMHMSQSPRLRSWHLAPLIVLGLLFSACHSPQEDPADTTTDRETSGEPLLADVRILVVDDPLLAGAIRSQWEPHVEGRVHVTETTAANISAMEEQDNTLSTDVVVYPSYLLGELAERELIVTIPQHMLDNKQLSIRDVLPVVRLRETKWGTQPLAIGFGSPQLTLFYREDLFQALQCKPPATWKEYQDLARRLAQPESEDLRLPTPWHGCAEPLGPGWAAQVLLARAAAYAKHRSNYSTIFDYRSMEPLIAGPPFVRALDELVTSAGNGPPESTTFTPADTRRLFYEGHCAMALSWPVGSDTLPETVDVQASFAELPGADQVYHFQDDTWQSRGEDDRRIPLLATAGRLGSVTRESRRGRAALHVLCWLTGKELGSSISSSSPATTLFRASQLSKPDRWLPSGSGARGARQYADVVAAVQMRNTFLFTLRIPGARQYMDVLDQAVQAAVQGEQPSEVALKSAANQWVEITRALGLENQRRAYRRSLGLEQ